MNYRVSSRLHHRPLRKQRGSLDVISSMDTNLRLNKPCTRKKREKKITSSKYPNVCWMKVGQNWRAKKQHSTPDGVTHHLRAQFFESELEAASCVDAWIRELMRQYPEDYSLSPLLNEIPNCEESDQETPVDEKLKEGLQRVKEAEQAARRGVKRSRELPKLLTPEFKRRKCGYAGCAKILRPGDRLLPVEDMMVCNADYQYYRNHGYLVPISERTKGKGGKGRQHRQKFAQKENLDPYDDDYVPPSMVNENHSRAHADTEEITFQERINLNSIQALADVRLNLSRAQKEEHQLKIKLLEKQVERESAQSKLASLQEILDIPGLVSAAFGALVQNKLLTNEEAATLLVHPPKEAQLRAEVDCLRFAFALNNSQLRHDLKLKIRFLLEENRMTKTKAMELFENMSV